MLSSFSKSFCSNDKIVSKLSPSCVSKTFDTYHFYGLAIDLVVYIKGVGITWDDKKYKNNYDTLLTVCAEVIKENNLPIQNGFALWSWDKPHFQMTNYKKNFDSRKILSKFFFNSDNNFTCAFHRYSCAA